MKKLFMTLMALLMAGTVCGCTKTDTPDTETGNEDEVLTSEETYTVTTTGFGGDMTVDVTFDGDVITGVEITNHSETDGVGTLAIDEMPSKIISANDYMVDAVSGATITSEAIMDAVSQAVDMKYGTGTEGEIEDGFIADTKTEMALEAAMAGSEWPAFMYVEAADLEAITGVTADEMVEHVFAMPMMMTHATSMIIIEAKDADTLASITTKMNTYFAGVEEQWSTYLPDQHELTQNRVEMTEGNYYIGVIAQDAQTVANTIVANLAETAK